jgi:hypothetical protein
VLPTAKSYHPDINPAPGVIRRRIKNSMKTTIRTEHKSHNGGQEPVPRRATRHLRRPVMLMIASVFFGMVLPSQAQTQIPGTFVLPSTAANTSQPGFVWHIHQVASTQPNENSRTEKQLAGLLGDNLADPAAQGVAMAPASPASPSTAPIRFDIAGVMNMSLNGAEYAGNFSPDDVMPGVPGTTGSYDNLAAEILTWLDLPAGTITMGVNSDDGFLMTVGGATPVDKFAPVVGAFNGGRGASDSLFTFTVSQAGLHAVRCTWEQGYGGANIEIFTVNPNGSRVLVNDTANGGIRAWRAVTPPARAYARKVSPAPNSTSAGATAPIVVELVDGATSIDATTTALTLDGASVPVTRSKSGGVTTVTFTPASYYASGSGHAVVFRYKENGAVVQVPWTFTVVNYVGPNGHIYEVVLAENGITWPDAKVAAASKGGNGVVSHLATITSYEEDLFLEMLRQSSRPDREDGQLWVGGYQQKNSPDFWEPAGGWVWLNNEGPILWWWNSPYPDFTYTNWLYNQPDNAYVEQGASEDYLAIGLSNSFGWNDDGYYAGGRRDGTLGGYIVEYEPVTLLVDIKPGDATNPVNLVSNGKLPVAILSTATFNANQLDIASIRFGRTGSEAAPVSSSMEDVNGDRKKDLVLQFNVQDTELLGDDTGAVLTARTTSGMPARGYDGIKVIACPHYSLTATALQDVNKLTDLELVVHSQTSGAITPAMASQVQLKSFDAVGKLHWTKTFQNVALQQRAQNQSVGNVQSNDAVPHQPVKVKMQVPYSGGTNTEVIYGATVVLLRPDLAVENLIVPAVAEPCQVVNIMATIRELNGDLGASAYAWLYDGDQVVDTSWLWVGPRGSADVVFSRVFAQGGTHALKVVVGEVAPGEYDPSNNSAPASIEIGPRPFSPVGFNTYYDRLTREYQSEYQNSYYSSLYHESVNNERLNADFFLSPNLKFPFQDVTIQVAADGNQVGNYQLGSLDADYVYDSGDYYDGYAYRELGNDFTLYLRSYSYGGCSGAVQAQLYHSAEDYVYHSEFHDFYWGTTYNYDYENHYGSYLNAASSFEVRFVLKHDAGTFGGTTGSNPIYTYPFNYEWDYEYFDGFQRGYSRGEEFFGSNSGSLTP